MLDTESPTKKLKSYSVAGLYAAGMRFSDWSANDAIDEYLKLHPEANEAKVRAELERAISPDSSAR